ncbi:MAG: ATP-binding cassette domain-containing protein [Desulfococcaceae bacterium]|jgi:ABC-type multidrug transport system ATPase subunit|nr:ATP-binding cassette domain-containing protein [Desulfococcaceae bacterium]
MQLECRNISYSYPGSEAPVFRNISFCWAEAGFHALFGPSGVGKSTFAGILWGSISPASGEIISRGIDRVGYSYNLERLPGWSPVGKHISKITPEGSAGIREELIDIFGMEKCLGLRFSQLSLGQKNRVNLIRYLLQDFPFLILDESLANVDEMRREKIILHIKALFPETFFLYISHNIMEVSRFCKDILVFQGMGKHSRTRHVKGRDMKKGENPDPKASERIMLEIMNAV